MFANLEIEVAKVKSGNGSTNVSTDMFVHYTIHSNHDEPIVVIYGGSTMAEDDMGCFKTPATAGRECHR